MLHKFFLTALTILALPIVGEARVIETDRAVEALSQIDEDTWVLVDLDNTLFEAKTALGHANWFYDEVGQRMQQGMDWETALRDFYPNWIKTQEVCEVQPLEEGFVSALIDLQKRGVVVMGLTHRQPIIAPFTVRQVDSLGIDFAATAPMKENFTLPAANPTLYLKGILFVNDFNKKGDLLLTFFDMAQKTPKKVIFFDDRRKNVEELEEVLNKMGIQYVGVYYTAFEHSHVYSRELAAYAYQFFGKILSNEVTAILMQQQNQ